VIELAIDGPEWGAYVAAHSESRVFHHPSWTLLLAECYGFRPFALAVRTNGSATLGGGIPVLEVGTIRRARWISQPFTDSCPPLVDAGFGPLLAAELDDAVLAAGVRRLEVRGSFPGLEAPDRLDAVTHAVELDDDPDVVLARVSRHVRKNLRAAERAGLVVRRGEAERDLTETFYRLQLETRRRLGVPIQPRRWYRLLWRKILEPGLGFLLLAHQGATPVAGAVFLAWNRTLTAKYSASTAAAWGIRPNNGVFWEAMRWGCENGYHTFDFGRTDCAADGLRRFKRAWGVVEQPLHYTVIGSPAGDRQLPSAVTALVRSTLRHSPLVATRALGELFYRFAA
jgi:CelD/BcsL family acetyltransferase involved in cellulose biosynthesis